MGRTWRSCISSSYDTIFRDTRRLRVELKHVLEWDLVGLPTRHSDLLTRSGGLVELFDTFLQAYVVIQNLRKFAAQMTIPRRYVLSLRLVIESYAPLMRLTRSSARDWRDSYVRSCRRLLFEESHPVRLRVLWSLGSTRITNHRLTSSQIFRSPCERAARYTRVHFRVLHVGLQFSIHCGGGVNTF